MSASSSLGTRLTGAARFGTRATSGTPSLSSRDTHAFRGTLQWFQVQSQSLLVCWWSRS